MHAKIFFKKEKKTEHTRMHAQLCSSTSAIFTSVVVYSRTTIPQKTQNTRVGLKMLALR